MNKANIIPVIKSIIANPFKINIVIDSVLRPSEYSTFVNMTIKLVQLKIGILLET